MTRLVAIAAILAFVLAYPRIALMLAVLVTSGTVVIVRYLMHNATIFQAGRRSYA